MVNTSNLTPVGLVVQIADLVTLPEAALRIARMVNDPNTSSSDIGREISNDAALTARLLRIANSPAFGQRGKIADISRAITVLGIRQVRDLTVGLAAVRSFAGISNELVSMESFWRHSLLCAVAAGHIASRRRGNRGDSPFVAGLLHDIGQLVIFNRVPELARKALSLSLDDHDDQGLYLCERALMGFDHQIVGVVLAQRWDLPRSLQECIEFHHEPHRAQAHPTEVATIHIANSVAVLAEIDSTSLRDVAPLSPTALKLTQLDEAGVLDMVHLTIESAAEMMPLVLGA
jgi:putative nucleotidyltransferase with HDIG domain